MDVDSKMITVISALLFNNRERDAVCTVQRTVAKENENVF